MCFPFVDICVAASSVCLATFLQENAARKQFRLFSGNVFRESPLGNLIPGMSDSCVNVALLDLQIRRRSFR